MTDWKHLTETTTKHEKALIAFLGSIERPSGSDDHYRAFYDNLELALGYLGDARAVAQATPEMQGVIDEDGGRLQAERD